jgi:hypothetical protein
VNEMKNSDLHSADSVERSAADVAQEQQFIAQVKQQLDSSCAALDGATLSRLHSMRSAAVAAKRSQRRWYWWSLSGLATACALLVMVNVLQQAPAQPVAEVAVLEDLELLTESEEIDLYEDYEFYQWLASE